MYKINVILECNGAIDELRRTVDFLESTTRFKESGRLVAVFDKEKFTVDPDALRLLYSVKNVKCIFGKPNKDEFLKIFNSSDYTFIMQEGTAADPIIFDYLDSFYRENKNKCGVTFLPYQENKDDCLPEEFSNLPRGGLVPLDARFPRHISGAAIWGKDLSPEGFYGEKWYDFISSLIDKMVQFYMAYGKINKVKIWNNDLSAYPVCSNTKASYKAFLVSCIIPVYKVEKYLSEAIDSVLNQSIDFLNNVQLILVNDGSPDNCSNICRSYLEAYPENICYIEQENRGVSTARNAGLDVAQGEYIAFLDGDDRYEKNYFEETIRFFESNKTDIDLVIVPLQYFEARTGEHVISKRFTNTGIISIDEEEDASTFHTGASLYKGSALENIRFDRRLSYAEDGQVVLRVILGKRKFGVVRETHYNYRVREDESSAIKNAKNSVKWYHDKMKYFDRFMIEYCLRLFKHVPRYIQRAVWYELAWYKADTLPESVADYVNIADMFVDLDFILKYIDDDIILSSKHLGYWAARYMLFRKNGRPKLCYYDGATMVLYGDSYKENPIGTVWIKITKERDGVMQFGGAYNVVDFDMTKLVCYYNGTEYIAELSEVVTDKIYYFGEMIYKSQSFDFNIPYNGDGKISFYLLYSNGELIPPKINFKDRASRINVKYGFYEYCGDTALITFNENNGFSFYVKRIDTSIREAYLVKMLNTNNEEKDFFRTVINNYETISKRRIWVFMDRVDSADDNAEALFKFAMKQEDGISKYFILKEGCRDYLRMQQYGPVVSWGSTDHKALLFFAEKFISSQAIDLAPAFENLHLQLAIINCHKVFLQHGIIKDDISYGHNRYVKDYNLFVTSNKNERLSIINGNYGYNEKTVVLTGLPRYDYLCNDPKNVIIFAPTWRSSILSIRSKDYNPKFKETEYYKSINSFLADESLYNILNNNGYKLIFKPHPEVQKQVEDFSFNDLVILADSLQSYHELYKIGSLMITDYSSTVFDFVYLEKPVIYYHTIPNHYPASYFDYNKDGFGEVVSNKEDLIDLLESYMHRNCKIKKIYLARAKEFYAYRDKNNCKRTYEAILNMDTK